MFGAIKKNLERADHERLVARRTEEANSRFNVVMKDGRLVVTYNGIIVSRGSDTDIMERLIELRERYIND